MKINKKAEGEYGFIIFLAVFIAVMGIIGNIFNLEVLQETEIETEDEGWRSDLKDQWDAWTGALTSPFEDTIIGEFFEFMNTAFDFVYVHAYLRTILIALFGVPIGYIFLRLLRGGG